MQLLESNAHNLFERYALQGPIHVVVNGLIIPVVEKGTDSSKATEILWENGDHLRVSVDGHHDDADIPKAQLRFSYVSRNGNRMEGSEGVLFEGQENKRKKFKIVHEKKYNLR